MAGHCDSVMADHVEAIKSDTLEITCAGIALLDTGIAYHNNRPNNILNLASEWTDHVVQ